MEHILVSVLIIQCPVCGVGGMWFNELVTKHPTQHHNSACTTHTINAVQITTVKEHDNHWGFTAKFNSIKNSITSKKKNMFQITVF